MDSYVYLWNTLVTDGSTWPVRRKEAIIGIPGIETSVAVATEGGVVSLGHQINVVAVEGGGVRANKCL